MRACDSPSPTVRRPPKEAFTQNTGWGEGRDDGRGRWEKVYTKQRARHVTHTHTTQTHRQVVGVCFVLFFCVFWGIGVQ